MDLWLSLPPTLCRILGSYFTDEERNEQLTRPKALTKCVITQRGSNKHIRYREEDVINGLKRKVKQVEMEGALLLLKLLGYDKQSLMRTVPDTVRCRDFMGNITYVESSEEVFIRRSVVETVMVCWSEDLRNLFVSTFNILPDELQDSLMEPRSCEYYSLPWSNYFKDTFRACLELERGAATELLRARGLDRMRGRGAQAYLPEILNLEDMIALIQHLNAKPYDKKWNSSVCSAKMCECKLIRSEVYFIASHMTKYVVNSDDKSKVFFCRWLECNFKSNVPTESDIRAASNDEYRFKNKKCKFTMAEQARNHVRRSR